MCRLRSCASDAALLRDLFDASTGTSAERSPESMFADDHVRDLSRMWQDLEERLSSEARES